jgi:hypothetical protein
MSSTTLQRPAARAHTVPAHPTLRHHRSQVVRWALAHGHRIDRDTLAAVVAVRSNGTTGELRRRWTADDVARLVWSDVPLWCSSHGVPAPVDLATTLSTYLRFLSAHRLLDTGSDQVTVLRRAVSDQQPARRASRSRHPAMGGSGERAPVLPIS